MSEKYSSVEGLEGSKLLDRFLIYYDLQALEIFDWRRDNVAIATASTAVELKFPFFCSHILWYIGR